MRFARDEAGQGLLVVLALVGLVSAVAYGYMALASTANQQATLRAAQLTEYRLSDAGATYALWYATTKGFPPAGALAAPDPGDATGAPAVTISDLRPGLAFSLTTAGPAMYDSPGHTLTGNGDVWLTLTWQTDTPGSGDLEVLVDTTPTYATLNGAGSTVSMPAGASQTTSTLGPWQLGPGTFYLHVENVSSGGQGSGDIVLDSVDTNGAASGHFNLNYPGMRFQALSTRNGRTTALVAGLTRTGGTTYSAAVSSWTLR